MYNFTYSSIFPHKAKFFYKWLPFDAKKIYLLIEAEKGGSLLKYKRELSKLAKEQMFDSYMKSAIRNYCKEFVRNYFKERGNAKEVPLDEFIEELSTSGPDDKDLLSLFLLSVDNPVDEFINRIRESISDDMLYKSLQQLTDLQIKVFCLKCLLNYKFQIIAELCETSVPSAKNINHAAKVKLFRLYNNSL
jgi:DNA-directed RNA polymerase specialized sigma24 family protein